MALKLFQKRRFPAAEVKQEPPTGDSLTPEAISQILATEDPVKLVYLIRRKLIAKHHFDWMLEQDLSIKQVLEHQYTSLEQPVVQTMFDDWNTKLRTQRFKTR